jgi:hypothetical protein
MRHASYVMRDAVMCIVCCNYDLGISKRVELRWVMGKTYCVYTESHRVGTERHRENDKREAL